MKNLTVKEMEKIIKDYKLIKARIRILKQEKKSINKTGLSAMSFVKVKVENNQIYSATEEMALENNEKREIIDNKIYILKKRIEILDEALKSTSYLEENIIRKKLIEQQPYYQICGDLAISKRHAINLKKRGLEKITKLINENTNFFEVNNTNCR